MDLARWGRCRGTRPSTVFYADALSTTLEFDGCSIDCRMPVSESNDWLRIAGIDSITYDECDYDKRWANYPRQRDTVRRFHCRDWNRLDGLWWLGTATGRSVSAL